MKFREYPAARVLIALAVSVGAGAVASGLGNALVHSGSVQPALAERPVVAASDLLALPFEMASNKMYMQARVNGAGPYPFVLDTGAPFSVMDWGLAEGNGIGVSHVGEVGGAGERRVKLGVATGVRISVGGLRFQPTRMEVIPLNEVLAQAEGRDVMGLLGGDILKRFVSEMDFTDRVVRLHPVGSFKYEGPGARVPVTVDGHVLVHATVTIAGREPVSGRFIVDTGARIAVSLNTHEVQEHRLMEADIPQIRTTIGWGIGGPLEHGLTRAESLQIGDVKFDGPTVTLSADTKGVFASRRISGVIGNEVLKRCRVYLDYSREEMYLEPTESARAPFPADASGLFITASGADHQTYTVRTVVSGSPGEEAGIKPGDVIVRIGGGPVNRYTLESLRELLREPGKSHEVEVSREGTNRLMVTVRTRGLI